jgi:hypothetical protein
MSDWQVVEPAPWVQIQAGHELAKLVELVRFTPGQAVRLHALAVRCGANVVALGAEVGR